MHPRQRALVDRELGGVEYLDARVLPAVERRHHRRAHALLAAQPERDLVLCMSGDPTGYWSGHGQILSALPGRAGTTAAGVVPTLAAVWESARLASAAQIGRRGEAICW